MKFYVKADVYNELIEKAYGKRDLSKLTRKVVTDKNGHRRTVFVRNDVQTKKPTVNTQEEITYKDMKQFTHEYSMDELMTKRADDKKAIEKYEGMFKKMAANGIDAKKDRPDLYEKYAANKGHLRAVEEEINARDKKRLDGAKEKPSVKRNSSINNKEDLRVTKYDFKTWLEDNDIVPEEYEGKSKNEIIAMARKTGLNQSDSEKAADDIKAYLSEDPRTYKETYWILDNRGNRMTNSDAKERVINNNKKIAELDKQISGMSKADAIRLNTQKHDLEYQNSYLMDRLNPKDRKEIESAKREE